MRTTAALIATALLVTACGGGDDASPIDAAPVESVTSTVPIDPSPTPDAAPSPQPTSASPAPPEEPDTEAATGDPESTPSATQTTATASPSSAPPDPPGDPVTYDGSGTVFENSDPAVTRSRADGDCAVGYDDGVTPIDCVVLGDDPDWGVVVWSGADEWGVEVVVGDAGGFDVVAATPAYPHEDDDPDVPDNVVVTGHGTLVQVDVGWPDDSGQTELVFWGEGLEPAPHAVTPRRPAHASWYVAGWLMSVGESPDGRREVDLVEPGAVFEGRRWTLPFGRRLNHEVVLRFLYAWREADRDTARAFAADDVVRNLFALAYSPDTLVEPCEDARCVVHRYRPELTNVELEVALVGGDRQVVGWEQLPPDPEGDY